MVEVVKELTSEERRIKDTIVRELGVVKKTGKLVMGFRRVLREIYKDNIRLVIMASDIPEERAQLVRYYCKLAEIPLIFWPDDVKSLGEALGRPHIVSIIGVIDPGTSNIMSLAKQD